MAQYFFQPKDVKAKEIAPGAKIKTFWGDKIMISIVDIEPETVVPMHTHVNEQAGIVLKGSLQMTIAGEERTLKESDIYVIPSNVEHGVIQRDKACQVADLFSPPREDYK